MNPGQPILQRRLDECPAGRFKCQQVDSNSGGTCCQINQVCCSNGACCDQGQTCALVSGRLGCMASFPQATALNSGMTTSTTSSLSMTTRESTTTGSTAPTNTASVPQTNLEGDHTSLAWMAGPIVGSIVGLLLIIFCCISCRRKNQRQSRKETQDEVAPAKTKEEQIRFEKAELEDYRVQRRTGSIYEAPSKDALPHELYGDYGFKSELP